MSGALFGFFVVLTVQGLLLLYGHRMDVASPWFWPRLIASDTTALLCGYYLEAMLKAVFGKEIRR